MDSQEVILALLPYLDELGEGVAEGAFCDEREDAERCARRVTLLRFDEGIEEFAIHRCRVPSSWIAERRGWIRLD